MSDTTAIKRVQKVNIIGPDGSTKYNDVYLAPDADKILVNPTDTSGNKASLQDFLLAKYDTIQVDGIDEDGEPIKETIKIRAIKEDGAVDYYSIDPSKTSFFQEWNDYQECLKRRLVGIYDENGNYTGQDFLVVDENPAATQENIEKIVEEYGFQDYTVTIGGETVTVTKEAQAEKLLADFSKKSIYQHLINLESFWVELPIENYEEATTISIASKREIAALSLLNDDWGEQNEPT